MINTFTDRRPKQQQPRQQQPYNSAETWKHRTTLESLADRTQPLPTGVSVEQLLKIAAQQLIEDYDKRWGMF